MSYITDIFERLNLQHIRSFLLDGTECLKISQQTYEQRIKDAGNLIFEKVSEQFPAEKEREAMMDQVLLYGAVNQDVYFEMGMQCGMTLAMQVLWNHSKESF